MDINIICKMEEKTPDAESVVPASSVPANESDKNNAKNESEKAQSSNMVFVNYAMSIAQSTARQTANYFISNIGRKNGDSNYQDLINRQIEVATDVLGFGSSIFAGAKLGSAFGPIGMLAGAILGGTASGINIGFKQLERQSAYEYEQFKEKNSQAYQLSQAGYSVWSGRKPS